MELGRDRGASDRAPLGGTNEAGEDPAFLALLAAHAEPLAVGQVLVLEDRQQVAVAQGGDLGARARLGCAGSRRGRRCWQP